MSAFGLSPETAYDPPALLLDAATAVQGRRPFATAARLRCRNYNIMVKQTYTDIFDLCAAVHTVNSK